MSGNMYIADGMSERIIDAHGFVIRLVKHANSLGIRIPKGIIDALGLRSGDLVEVIIRKVSDDYALIEYGYVPGRRSLKITCPVCGKPGNIVVKVDKRRSLLAFISHNNNNTRIWHYISPYIHTDTFIEVLKTYLKERGGEISPERRKIIEEVIMRFEQR